MARPRKLINDDNIKDFKRSKEEIAQRQAEQSALEEFEQIRDNPPHYLPYMAKLEWKRILPLLKDLNISELDLTMVASYCQLYNHWRQLNNDLNKNGQIIIKEDGEGNEISRQLNPSFNAMMKVQTELRQLSGQLGMTINSRMQLVVPEDEEEQIGSAS